MPIAQVCSDVAAAYVQNVESQTLNLLRPFQQMCNSKKVILKLYALLEAFDYGATVLPCQTRLEAFGYEATILPCQTREIFTYCQSKSGASRNHCA